MLRFGRTFTAIGPVRADSSLDLFMEYKTLLGKYHVALDTTGAPVQLHASAAGSTYKAQEIDSGREVAVELIPAGTLGPSAREQLETEALSAKQLNHINIPTLYDFGWEGDHAVYVTEYLDGTTTEAWVKGHGPMQTSAVLRIALQVLAALGAAAFHRIVHHAINPTNLMIVPGQTTEGGWPLIKLLHLVGLAPKAAETERGESARFASPEQLQTGAVDLRSEIYSLGCTLQFLLTGTPPIAPWEAIDGAKVRRAVRRLRGIPKNVRVLLAQMVAVNPTERPHDPIALYESIQDALMQVERREALARKFGVVPPRRRVIAIPLGERVPMKPLALAAALIALAAIAALALPERYGPRHLFGLRGGPVGVPIGIPEAQTSTAPTVVQAAPQKQMPMASTTANQTISKQNTSTPNPNTSVAAIVPSTNDKAVAENAPQSAPAGGELFSTAGGGAATEDSDTAQSEAVGSTNTNRPAITQPDAVTRSNETTAAGSQPIAANNAAVLNSPAPTSANAAQTVAANDVPAPQNSEPAPPAEGPRAADTGVSTNNSAQSNSVAAANSPVVTEQPAPAAQTLVQPSTNDTAAASEASRSSTATEDSRIAANSASKPRAKNKTVSKSKSQKRIRVARALPVNDDDANAPAPTRGTVHARVIGTTADGRLVLSVPSRGTAVAGPADSDIPAEGPPPRRVRRAIPVPDFLPPPPPIFPPDE
jgi:serine/threonine-protein kinase